MVDRDLLGSFLCSEGDRPSEGHVRAREELSTRLVLAVVKNRNALAENAPVEVPAGDLSLVLHLLAMAVNAAATAERRESEADGAEELARLREENDAMRQLFQVWLMVDSLSWEQRAELARRTAELGGKRHEVPNG